MQGGQLTPAEPSTRRWAARKPRCQRAPQRSRNALPLRYGARGAADAARRGRGRALRKRRSMRRPAPGTAAHASPSPQSADESLGHGSTEFQVSVWPLRRAAAANSAVLAHIFGQAISVIRDK